MYTEVFSIIRKACELNKYLKDNISVLSADTCKSVKSILLKNVLEVFGKDNSNGRLFSMPLAENMLFNVAEGMAHEGIFPIIGIYEALIKIVLEELDSMCRSFNSTKGLLVVATHSGLSCPDGRGIQSVTMPSILSRIPNLKYIEPASIVDVKPIVNCILNCRRGIYILRCPHNSKCLNYVPDGGTILGCAGLEILNNKINDEDYKILIICNASLVKEAFMAVKEIDNVGLSIHIIIMQSIILADDELAWLRYIMKKAELIITLHDSYGGYLGKYITEVRGQSTHNTLINLDVAGYGQCGDYNELLRYYNIDKVSIINQINKHYSIK